MPSFQTRSANWSFWWPALLKPTGQESFSAKESFKQENCIEQLLTPHLWIQNGDLSCDNIGWDIPKSVSHNSLVQSGIRYGIRWYRSLVKNPWSQVQSHELVPAFSNKSSFRSEVSCSRLYHFRGGPNGIPKEVPNGSVETGWNHLLYDIQQSLGIVKFGVPKAVPETSTMISADTPTTG